MNKQLIYLNIKLTLRSLIFYLSFSFFTVAYAFLAIQLRESGTFFENFDRMAYIEIVLYLMLFCVAMFFAQKESKLEDVCFVPKEQTYFARLVALLLCSAVYLLIPGAHLIIGAIKQGIGGSYLLRSLLLAVVRWGMIIVSAQTIGYLVGYIARSVYAYLFSIPFTILQSFSNTYMFEKLFGLGEDSETGLPVIAYSSLGRGFFSGKFKSYDYEAAKRVLDHAAQKGYLSEDNMERLRRAEILAAKKGCAVSEIAMRYLFSGDMNVFAVVSTTDPERLRQNVRAFSGLLTKEEAQWLDLTV